MSNDSQKPEPGKEKTPPKPSNFAGKATESDLWDLDVIAPDDAPEPAKSDALPPRRTNSSYSLPKRPNEVGGVKPSAYAVKKADKYGSGTPIYGEPKPKASGEPEYKVIASGTPTGDDDEPATKAPEPAEAPEPTDEPVATPYSGSLTKTEKIAITALFAALFLAAILAVIHFTNRVPTRSTISEQTEYPVSGKLIEVKSAVTYWRKPVTTGDNPDVVRRGTALLPVVKLSLSSKPGAIRVFFRDEEGVVIGDGISRDVKGDQELLIAATAGFDDLGMHAAYRTGEKEPWIVQVYEGPSRSADRKEFRKVLETQVSTDRR